MARIANEPRPQENWCFNKQNVFLSDLDFARPQDIVIIVDGTRDRTDIVGHCFDMDELANLSARKKLFYSERAINNNAGYEWSIQNSHTREWLGGSVLSAIEAGWNTILITEKQKFDDGRKTLLQGKPIHRATFINGTLQQMLAENLNGDPTGEDKSSYKEALLKPKSPDSPGELTEEEKKKAEKLRTDFEAKNRELLARQSIADAEYERARAIRDAEEFRQQQERMREYENARLNNRRALPVERVASVERPMQPIARWVMPSIEDIRLQQHEHALTILNAIPADEEHIDIFDKNLSGILPDLSRFTHVTSLNCGSNSLTGFTNLPATLTTLVCSFNRIIQFPELPPNLRFLECGNNKLVSIDRLPQTLVVLNCSYNALRDLNDLPDSLEILNISNNEFISLPELPNGLRSLNCSSNEIILIESLPESLISLNCKFNFLLSIPPRTANMRTYEVEPQRSVLEDSLAGVDDDMFDLSNDWVA